MFPRFPTRPPARAALERRLKVLGLAAAPEPGAKKAIRQACHPLPSPRDGAGCRSRGRFVGPHGAAWGLLGDRVPPAVLRLGCPRVLHPQECAGGCCWWHLQPFSLSPSSWRPTSVPLAPGHPLSQLCPAATRGHGGHAHGTAPRPCPHSACPGTPRPLGPQGVTWGPSARSPHLCCPGGGHISPSHTRRCCPL